MTDASTARYLTPKLRVKTVPLEWPFAIGTTEYRNIIVKRLTTKEIDDFVASIRDAPDDTRTRFPIFRNEQDEIVSDEVWDAIDDDDKVTLNRVGLDFLPARFKAQTMEGESANPSTFAPSTSNTGASSSAEPLAADIPSST